MIDLEKFDQLNEKLLNKLTSDFNILSEDLDGDPFKNISDMATDNHKKAESEAKESYYKVKDMKTANAPEEAINAMEIKQMNDLIKRKKASVEITQNRKLKKIAQTTNEDFDIDNISDEEIANLAEEFEADLFEAQNGLDQLKDNLEAKKANIQNDLKSDLEKSKQTGENQIENAKAIATTEKTETAETNQNKIQQLETKASNTEEKLKSSAESKINNIDRQIAKVDSLKANQKNSSQPQVMTEGFKKSINNIKISLASKKFDKLSKKRGELVVKINKLENEYRKAEIKQKTKKMAKYMEKISKLKVKLAEINEKYQKEDAKLVKLGEDYQFLDEIDLLCESVDILLAEVDRDLALFENDLLNNPVYCKYQSLLESEYQEPMAKKLVQTINEELLKDDQCDYQKINILIAKLKNIRG